MWPWSHFSKASFSSGFGAAQRSSLTTTRTNLRGSARIRGVKHSQSVSPPDVSFSGLLSRFAAPPRVRGPQSSWLPPCTAQLSFSSVRLFARSSHCNCPSADPLRWRTLHSFAASVSSSSSSSSFAASGASPSARTLSGWTEDCTPELQHVSFPFHGKDLDIVVTTVEDEKAFGSKSAASALIALTRVRPDFVLLSLGYLDYDKIIKKTDREDLLKPGKKASIESLVRDNPNGAYVPVIQQMRLKSVFHCCIGRSKLADISATAERLMLKPIELYSVLGCLLFGKRLPGQGGGTTGQQKGLGVEAQDAFPVVYQTLMEDGPRFMALKLHQRLLDWTGAPAAREEHVRDWSDRNKWVKVIYGRSRKERELRASAASLEQMLLFKLLKKAYLAIKEGSKVSVGGDDILFSSPSEGGDHKDAASSRGFFVSAFGRDDSRE
ncbi:transmembrane protein [Cystoisospora suis]|uniref:Transmembrane protein n=1 Tax=Cystoisospora suis TaxID=483139 RepID=A0A2C6LDD6_9APIC|nr:transmembrane protein [Cystoisospora suis]